jgi:hypothetical protein
LHIATYLEVLEKVVNTGLNVERVEPKSEHPRLAFSLGIEVVDRGRRLGFLERRQARPGVEQVSDKGEVEFRVTRDKRVCGKEPSAAYLVRVLQDLFGALVQIARLERGAGALVRLELVEKDGIVLAIRYIPGKVLHPILLARSRISLTSCATPQLLGGS